MFYALLACGPDGFKLDPTFDTGEKLPDTQETEEESGDSNGGETDTGEPGCGEIAVAEAGTVPLDEVCAAGVYRPDEVVVDPWSAQISRTWTGNGGSGSYPVSSPVFADIDDDGAPELFVCIEGGSSGSGRITIFDGESGDPERDIWGCSGDAELALADLDADGKMDVVGGYSGGAYLAAWETTGTPLWYTRLDEGYAENAQVVVTDLDGNNVLEVIIGVSVLRGTDGDLLYELDVSEGDVTSVTAGDLDLDGEEEILVGRHVLSRDGTQRWSAEDRGTTFASNSAIVQGDDDAYGEVFVAGSSASLYDHDGTLLWSAPLPGGNVDAGAVCAADLDADGQVELLVPALGGTTSIVAYERDGDIRWQHAITAAGTANPGCATWDVDGDGAAEVLYADFDGVEVLDGTNGRALVSLGDHVTYEGNSTPVVVDADGDGHGEILYTNPDLGAGSYPDVVAVGHEGGGWPAAGASWTQHDWTFGMRPENGRGNSTPARYWLDGYFRGRPAQDGLNQLADLRGTITDACVADCAAGPVYVSFQVQNVGSVASADVEVVLYAQDVSERREVWRGTTGLVDPGEATVGIEVELGADAIGEVGWTLVIDGREQLAECNDENEDTWTGTGC